MESDAQRFAGSFTQQEPIPDAAIVAAVDVLLSGRLHRYDLIGDEVGEVAQLEAENRDWQGSSHCLALTSGGQALQIALRACSMAPEDAVLTNRFTPAPVPGAIKAVGGDVILVEIDADLRLDLDDLAEKIASSGARFLLLSHMRGRLCDMDRLIQICDAAGITGIEDCTHTKGARRNGKRSGNFGKISCFFTQAYKHMDSGEGGSLTTDDPELAACATILSGSDMHYARHGAGPDEAAFDDTRYEMPNCSARMDALRAAILRAQLAELDRNIARWNARYALVERALKAHNRIATIALPTSEDHARSSIHFRLPDFTADRCRAFLRAVATRGVELKWFGASEPSGFTSLHRFWRHVTAQDLPKTDRVMATLFDMRLPLSFSEADCARIGKLICDAVREVAP